MALALLAALLTQAEATSAAPAPSPPPFLQALEAAGVDPKTKVDGDAVQVMFGQRAVVRLDEGAHPHLDAVEVGRIDRAAPADAKAFRGVGAGKLAFALDASAEKRVSMLKVWNALTQPIAFEAEVTALRGGKLMKKKEAACAVPAGGAAYTSWPDPIVAVTLTGIAPSSADTPACEDQNEKD
jgi:hypothetical protein